MQLIDTHTHIYLPQFDEDRDQAVSRAIKNNVVKLLMPNIDADSVHDMIAVENRFPGICYSMIGLHPTSVKEDFEGQLEEMENMTLNHRFYAVGEIGIDLYWDKSHLEEQIKAFNHQIEFALEKELPIVIHARDSFSEIFKIIDYYIGSGLRGVFHAFSGSSDDAKTVIGMGLKLGIGGVVTFKNSGLDGIVKEAGIENIILETDSPYLAPVPYRGKRNESSYLSLINDKVAGILELSNEETARITYNNSVQLFGL
jgi:TatD DNase family protein